MEKGQKDWYFYLTLWSLYPQLPFVLVGKIVVVKVVITLDAGTLGAVKRAAL